jgi:hypothetical protein
MSWQSEKIIVKKQLAVGKVNNQLHIPIANFMFEA